MKQFIRQEHKFLVAVLLTLVLIFAGIFMVFRVFQQYETLTIENEDRQLLGWPVRWTAASPVICSRFPGIWNTPCSATGSRKRKRPITKQGR